LSYFLLPDPNIFLLGEFLEENFVNFLGLLRLVGVGVDGGHLAVHLVLVVTLHRLLQHLCNNDGSKLQSCGSGSQGADSLPLFLHVEKTVKNHLNEEIIPLLITGIGERFSQTISKFRTCSALAPM